MILPRILVIDDQLATQASMRGRFCNANGLLNVKTQTQESNLGLVSASGDTMAEAVFSSGQVTRGNVTENSLKKVLEDVRSGWPSPDGWRWALVLVDLHFDSSEARAEDQKFGLKILDELVNTFPDPEGQSGNSELPIVMLSESARDQRAADANRAGAAAYVEKKELDRACLRQLLEEHGLIEDPDGILKGKSHALLKILREARGIASTAVGNALILGPKGSGKSSLARYIHRQSKRKGELVEYVSAASAKGLERSRMFGYWFGAHDGAKESQFGSAEEAHEGTLLIDEVHNLERMTQEELLQFGRLVDGKRLVHRLGNFPSAPESTVRQAEKSIRGQRIANLSAIVVDVLLLSATNEPLDDPDWRAEKNFSEPLYDRLAVEYAAKPLHFPSLAERADDIPRLFESFLNHWTKEIGGRVSEAGRKTVDPVVFSRLQNYSWPGNVAELEGKAKGAAQNAKDFAEVIERNLPALESSRSVPPWRPEKRLAPQPTIKLVEVEQAMRNVEVPRSNVELQGSLTVLQEAYGSLVKRLLEAALEQTSATESRYHKKALDLVVGKKTKTAADAYDEVRRLRKLFEHDPPAPGSKLDEFIRRANDIRNPRKGR
jgi:DNA-binding NtrC family response regulator